MRSIRSLIVTLAVSVAFTSQVHAFKVPTHVASANRVLDQLAGAITTTPGDTNTIVFEVKGRRLELRVSARAAYQAILKHQDFFRAGVIGPDGFPDLVTGQYWQHSNQNLQAQGFTRRATEGNIDPIDHKKSSEPWDDRHGPSEFRSIDFAMRLLDFLHRKAEHKLPDTEIEKALAFVMGYFAHGVGDSFAHTWVNEYAGGSWEFGGGRGVFGPVSEEVKHVAVEGLVDSRVPGPLLNRDGSRGGELDRLSIQAPVAFLDAFFSSQVPNALKGYGNKNASDPVEYVKFYRHVDQFYGSAVYNYFNFQVDAARAIQNFSGMKKYMDWAEKYQPGAFVNILLDIADWPNQVKEDFESWFATDVVSFVSGGFLRCELFNDGTTGLETVRKVWDYLGGFNKRIRRYEERATIARINYIRLGECTAQNLARVDGGNFDPRRPTEHRDACTVLADRPWQDQKEPLGLYRGSLREGVSEDDDEFLRDLKNYFRGADDDGDGFFRPQELIEPTNRHRHIGGNLSRLKSYLLGFAFTLDDLEDVIITDKHATDFDRICRIASDPAEKRCLNLRLLALSLPIEQGKCLVEFAKCEASTLLECAKGLCRTACSGTPLAIIDACGGICDAGEAACRGVFSKSCEFVPGACLGIPGLLCEKTFIYDGCVAAANGVCGVLAGGNESCFADVIKCGVKEIKCSAEALELLLLEKGYADYLLNPIKDVCATVNEARAFFDRYDTVAERVAEAEKHGVPVTKINELIDIYRGISDKFRGYPPEYFVNVAFVYEDLRQDPAYLADYLRAVEREAAKVQSLPPGRERDLRDGALHKLRGLGQSARTGKAPTELLTFDPAQDPDKLTDQAKRELEEFGEIVEMVVVPTVAGPTAKRILADIGPDFLTTFNPFFNTVAGMKLVPLISQGDVDRLFAQEGVPRDRLPWVLGGEVFSSHCVDGDPMSLYCDTLVSFDDPNCLGPEGQGCRSPDNAPDPARFGWIAGRGLVAWNPYDPTGKTKPHVLTAFPLASSEAAYNRLYTRIFEVPQRVPAFTGFEDPSRPWVVDRTGIKLSENRSNVTQGASSLQVEGCGYAPIRSPLYNTVEFEVLGDQLSLDVFVPEQQANPHWVGSIDVTVTLPAVGIVNRHLGHRELTNLPRNKWSTLTWAVPPDVRAALLGDFPDGQLALMLNLGSCQAPFLIDNLRFTGNLTPRTTFHHGQFAGTTVIGGPVLGFEVASDWTSPQTAVRAETGTKSQGNASLAVPLNGWVQVRSRPFGSAETPEVTETLNVDVFIPRPQPNRHWVGDVSLSLHCPGAGIFERPIGWRPLTHLFQGEFNPVRFDVPPAVRDVLRRPYADCSVRVALNGARGAGTFLLDRMGFVR